MGGLGLRHSNWHHFDPDEEATLLFVVKGRQVLLIDKKRGLGAGKINGPGGKIEDGETPMQAVVREVREELGVTPLHVSKRGELGFRFDSGYSMKCHVFHARDIHGEPVETNEATPRWETIGNLPFDRMWEDDQVWLPMLLAGLRFGGGAVFHGEKLIDHNIRPVEIHSSSDWNSLWQAS